MLAFSTFDISAWFAFICSISLFVSVDWLPSPDFVSFTSEFEFEFGLGKLLNIVLFTFANIFGSLFVSFVVVVVVVSVVVLVVVEVVVVDVVVVVVVVETVVV